MAWTTPCATAVVFADNRPNSASVGSEWRSLLVGDYVHRHFFGGNCCWLGFWWQDMVPLHLSGGSG